MAVVVVEGPCDPDGEVGEGRDESGDDSEDGKEGTKGDEGIQGTRDDKGEDGGEEENTWGVLKGQFAN